MRTIQFSQPQRSVALDRMAALLETAARAEGAGAYPPYDLEAVGENAYRIELAVAGFSASELEIEASGNALTIQGRKAVGGADRRFIHRGLLARNFERRFQLGEHVVVTSADLRDGLLAVSLERRTPDSLKPRRIDIATDAVQARTPAPTAEGRAQAA